MTLTPIEGGTELVGAAFGAAKASDAESTSMIATVALAITPKTASLGLRLNWFEAARIPFIARSKTRSRSEEPDPKGQIGQPPRCAHTRSRRAFEQAVAGTQGTLEPRTSTP